MEEPFVALIIFGGFYFIIKIISDHLLKRRIIMMGHVDKAGILDQRKTESAEISRYPSLKWGLVALCGGLGLIVTEMVRINSGSEDWDNPLLPLGIVLVSVSVGFLAYFLIVNRKK